MLQTALLHANDDILRARNLQAHAVGLPPGHLKNDILRASWMMAVGACDAFFSDAYADLVSRAIRAKELEPSTSIPDRLNNLRVPVTAILRPATGGWRWRMAARELIEEESVISLEKIKKLFNHFYPDSQKLFTTNTISAWITHPSAKSRLFGITSTQFRASPPARHGQIKQKALKAFEEHFDGIFQRRHDCIHNCDRPKTPLQPITETQVLKRIEDVEFLIHRCQESLLLIFPNYLRTLRFSGTTRARVSQ